MLTMFLVACGDPQVGGPPELPQPSANERSDLTITVVDAAGAGIEGAWVVLTPGSRDQPTDATGMARFLGVEPGIYAVVTTAEGFARSDTSVALGDADVGLGVTLTALERDEGGVTGQIQDAGGRQLPLVTVSLAGHSVTTDADGRYLIEGVMPGRYALEVTPARGVAGRWTSAIDVPGGPPLVVDVAVPGTIPVNASPIGTQVCAFCHPDEHAQWSETAHARPLRTPAELVAENHPIAADLIATSTVDLSPDLGEARLFGVGDTWQVDVDDANGVLIGSYALEDVYGGHGAGAAFVGRDGDGPRVLLPFAWGPEGPGLAQRAGFGVAYTDRWAAGPPSFDLACGGCHTTNARLVEANGTWAFEDAQSPIAVEDQVGCEACHGDGSAHRQAPSARAQTIVNPRRMDGRRQVEVCARCHGRYASTEHPFSEEPGWPATADGRLPAPDALPDSAMPDRVTFTVVPASPLVADRAGELLASPHQQGPLGYRGSCADCHLAHGSDHPADLRRDPFDDDLCTDCHGDLRSQVTQRAHAAHSRFAPGLWSPGGCVGCHMPRVASVGRRDPLSSVGDLRAHTLAVWHPDDIVADFDAAGTDTLPPAQVPIPGCLDCHAQDAELLAQSGFPFLGPLGDPLRRTTYVNLGLLFDQLWTTP